MGHNTLTYPPPYALRDSPLCIGIYLVGPAGGLVGSSQRSDGGRPATAAQGARRRPSSSTEGSGSSSISCSRDVALHHRLVNTRLHSNHDSITIHLPILTQSLFSLKSGLKQEVHPVAICRDRVSEDSSVLGELLQDVGGGGGREPKHCHPALSWTISTVQRLPLGVERVQLRWAGRADLCHPIFPHSSHTHYTRGGGYEGIGRRCCSMTSPVGSLDQTEVQLSPLRRPNV
jgi:hypothetical protein